MDVNALLAAAHAANTIKPPTLSLTEVLQRVTRFCANVSAALGDGWTAQPAQYAAQNHIVCKGVDLAVFIPRENRKENGIDWLGLYTNDICVYGVLPRKPKDGFPEITVRYDDNPADVARLIKQELLPRLAVLGNSPDEPELTEAEGEAKAERMIAEANLDAVNCNACNA